MRTTLRYFLFAPLLMSATRSSFSQVVSFDYILSTPHQKVEKYHVEEGRKDVFFVGFDFAKSAVQNPEVFQFIKSLSFTRIDFVYTRYKETSEFDQDSLNRKRLTALLVGAPAIFNASTIEWNIFEIKEAQKTEQNQKFFHGFVLYTRPFAIITPEGITMATEAVSRSEELKALAEHMDVLAPKVPLDYIHYKTKKKCRMSEDYLPRSANKIEAGIRYHNKSIWNRKKEKICDCTLKEIRGTIMVYYREFGVHFSPLINSYFSDTLISNVFNRNKAKWKNIMVVQDVTGSMGPYVLQTMVWHSLNDEATKAKHFVFFNDGDAHPDGPIGHSGGAYYIRSGDQDRVQNTCTSTMSKGAGGGGPENNIESLIYAIQQSPDMEEIVMIADNWAPVRDMTLLENVHRPIHIIVCGAYNGLINVDYLNIAFATGGSVHTMEDDIEHLSELTDGSVISIKNGRYKLIKDKFVLSH